MHHGRRCAGRPQVVHDGVGFGLGLAANSVLLGNRTLIAGQRFVGLLEQVTHLAFGVIMLLQCPAVLPSGNELGRDVAVGGTRIIGQKDRRLLLTHGVAAAGVIEIELAKIRRGGVIEDLRRIEAHPTRPREAFAVLCFGTLIEHLHGIQPTAKIVLHQLFRRSLL